MAITGTWYKGKVVGKKSKKPFQNKKRVAVIKCTCNVMIPGKGLVEAVFLEGCDSAVTIRTLTDNKDNLTLLKERDLYNPLDGIKE